ncbi:MAG: hypothetical protein ACFFAN_05375 [Promethearchaeota archaeon]
MPSYKIYLIKKKLDIEDIFSSQWLDKISINRGDLERTSQKINSIKENVKAPTLLKNKNLADIAFTIDYEYNMTLPGNIKVWVPEKLNMIQKESYLFITRGEGKFRFLIEKYLSNNFEFLSVDLSSKKLLKIWNKLKKVVREEGHSVILHRIIIGKAYIDADLIKELNITTKNVEEVGFFKELTQNSGYIKVITLRIRWNLFDEEGNRPKNLTARLDSAGNLLIYGTHSKNIIDHFLKFLTISL